MNSLASIAAMLRDRIGLDADTLGRQGFAHAVRTRIKARGVDGPAAYAEILAEDADESMALIEAVIVPETWFFRDREPFALLATLARDWLARTADDPVRVLSLPCATGEEAWSIAIALAAAGVRTEAIHIEARDVSARALAVAHAGIYEMRALRRQRLDPAWARYLRSRDDGRLEVASALRATVHLAPGNIVDAGGALTGPRFDAVFCRNLLIYCDAATRAAALTTFRKGLRSGGVLFLGHAETLPAGTPGFVREGPPGAFAWRRTDVAPARRRIASATSTAKAVCRPATAAKKPHTLTPTPRVRRPTVAAGIEHARGLADGGRLAEAAELAVAHIERAPDDARAHALLGVVRAAQGRDEEAGEHLRRALYLDPTHEEALVHLALILERHGDRTAAARLRDRARRVEEAR